MHDASRRRNGPASCLAAVLLFALAGGALVACTESPSQRELGPGTVVVARSEIETTDVKPRVLLPTGKLVFRAGEPLTRLEPEQTRDHVAYDAPEGSSFVPLRWVFHSKLFDGVQDVFGTPRTLSLSLVADGTEYGLAPPRMDATGESTNNFYVLVTGTPEELKLHVDYAGVNQRVDLETGKVIAGRARLMERAAEFPGKPTSECPTSTWFDFGPPERIATFGCKHTRAMVTPYIAGKFARAGYAFVVMRITTNFPNYLEQDGDGGQAWYHVQSSRDRTTMAGRRPIKVLGEGEHAGATDGWYAWRVELDKRGEPRFPDKVVFERRYRLKLGTLRGDMEADERTRLTISGDIPLSE